MPRNAKPVRDARRGRFLRAARQSRAVTALQQVSPLPVDTLSEAELIEVATRQSADDPDIPASHRAMHRLNRARALTFLALRNGDFDRLVDALPILSDVVQDPDLDPAVAMIAGRDLIEAHSLLVQHGGDPSRYGDSIELFARLVDENPGIPDARSLLHEQRAGYQQCVLSAAIQELADATSAGDQDRAEHACERIGEAWYAVERELRTALRLVAAGAEIIPEYLIMLGVHLCSGFELLDEDRSDEGVGLCRQALSPRSGRKGEQKPRSELYLAQCLVTRFEQRGDERDLDEAETLLRRLLRRGNPIEARARELLLKIAVLRQEIRQ